MNRRPFSEDRQDEPTSTVVRSFLVYSFPRLTCSVPPPRHASCVLKTVHWRDSEWSRQFTSMTTPRGGSRRHSEVTLLRPLYLCYGPCVLGSPVTSTYTLSCAHVWTYTSGHSGAPCTRRPYPTPFSTWGREWTATTPVEGGVPTTGTLSTVTQVSRGPTTHCS